jgi:hypothetical protein
MKTSFLPQAAINEIANSWNPQLMVIGGAADLKKREVKLIYGNFEVLTVPFAAFKSNPTARPNFKDFEIIDFGHTIRLGKYEAGADSFDNLRGWVHRKARAKKI